MNAIDRSLRFHVMIALACAAVTAGELTVSFIPSGPEQTVPTVVRRDGLWAALPCFFESLGFSWRWDDAAQQLTAVKNADRYVFSRDICWYSHNADLHALAFPPQRIGADLYVSIPTLLEIVSALYGTRFTWNPTTLSLTINQEAFTIVSVSQEHREGKDVYTIQLSDSSHFDYEYRYPRIRFAFSGATIDTAVINSFRKSGIVDSLIGLQTKESVGLTLVLSGKIKEPQVDYLEDQRVILLTLSPISEKSKIGKKRNEPIDATFKTIVIDPGHGGKDPGAIGPGGTREKDVVLGISLYLRDLLKPSGDIKVFLTRDKDIFVPLSQRTIMANERSADLFISIHANAMSGSKKKKETTTGYKVYFLSQAKNEEDKLAAMRENAVIELEEKRENYSALQNVLIDLAGNEYLRESQELSILLDQKFGRSLRKKISRQAKGIGQANFWVLNGAYMPSILIETGFISNRAEEKLLQSKPFQKQMAEAIRDVLLAFKRKYETEL
jgi:N-acetylmuramoyl-L-alanine amidase